MVKFTKKCMAPSPGAPCILPCMSDRMAQFHCCQMIHDLYITLADPYLNKDKLSIGCKSQLYGSPITI